MIKVFSTWLCYNFVADIITCTYTCLQRPPLALPFCRPCERLSLTLSTALTTASALWRGPPSVTTSTSRKTPGQIASRSSWCCCCVTRTHARTHARMYARTHACTPHVRTHACTHSRKHARTHAHSPPRTHTHTTVHYDTLVTKASWVGASTTSMGNEFQSLMVFGRKEEPLYWVLVVSRVNC